MEHENKDDAKTAGNTLVFLGIGIGILFWFFEAAIHSLIFYHGSLVKEIVAPDPHELWMRSFIVFLFIGFGFFAQSVVNSRRRAEEGQKRLVSELKEAMAEVKRLSGLLPICSSCKKIRDDKGYWNQLEAYIRDHAEVEFTHGICPECQKKLYSELKSVKK